MSDSTVYVIKNLNRTPVSDFVDKDGPVYEYITRASDDAPHGTPLGMSKEMADSVCQTLDLDPDEAVIPAPDDMIVVLDDSARKLPREGAATTLQQVSEVVRSI